MAATFKRFSVEYTKRISAIQFTAENSDSNQILVRKFFGNHLKLETTQPYKLYDKSTNWILWIK